jgi:alpha-beta hydrolase superfamily lysophospholipase
LGPETAQGRFWNTSDGAQHFLRVWSVDSPQAAVIYLHGIEGHGRWFEETAITMQSNQIVVYAPDRRGAGASKERRGHLDNYDRLVRDIEECVMYVKQRHAGVPVFLVANCWAAKAAILVAAGGRVPLTGLVMTSPAVSVKVDVDFKTKVLIALSYFVGSKDYFDIPLASEDFTDNAAYLFYIDGDPLRLRQATASFFIESLRLTSACLKASTKLTLPVLVLQSVRERIVNVEEIKTWFTTVSSADKELIMFENAAHSLDFAAEPDAGDYRRVLNDWLSKKAKPTLRGKR